MRIAVNKTGLNLTQLYVGGNVNLNLNWTKLQNYATACSGKNLMQGVGDNLTCIADTDTFNTTNEIRTAVNNSKLNLKNSMNYPGDTNAMFLLNFTSRKSSKSIIEDFYMCNINAFEDMLGVAASSGTLGVGTSASSHPGVCYLRDSTTAHGGYVIATDSAALLLSGGETSQFVFQRKNKKLLGIIRMGFLDQYTPRNRPSDGCYFDISNGNLSAQCRNNNATSQSARRNYTLTVDTWYVAKVFIEMNKLSANFTLYSGTTGQQLWSARLNNSIPINSSRQTGFGIIAGEGSTDAAADVVWIDYMSFNINGSLVR